MALTEEQVNTLWVAYVTEPTHEIKQKLILNYIWLVKYVQKSMSLPTNTILTSEDFTSIGILGLHEAIDRYELDRGTKFESYAMARIRGMIQDELRRIDWLSRTARKRASDLLSAQDELKGEKGGEVTQEDVMKKLGISPDKYDSYLAAAAAAKASLSLIDTQIVHVDNEEIDVLETVSDKDLVDSLDDLVNKERIGLIQAFIKSLAEKKKLVMSLYYYEELTFKEIGAIMSVSESRICQIHTQVIQELKVKLREYEHA
jgi:RNA polymerase sigma factor for flagellar operon FliA